MTYKTTAKPDAQKRLLWASEESTKPEASSRFFWLLEHEDKLPPDLSEASTAKPCPACGHLVRWVRKNEKNLALTLGGDNHWPSCKGKRKKKAEGPDMRAAPPIVGERYKPSCGQCDVPPWESCACSSSEGTVIEVNNNTVLGD